MTLLAKLLKALNSNASPWQIASAITLAMIFGLTPLLRLHNLIIVFLVLLFRVNLSTFIVMAGFFSALAVVLDPVMLHLGQHILTAEALQSLWSAFYSTDIGKLSQFNHTLTMGSLFLASVLSPLVLYTSNLLIVKYRESAMEWVNKLKIVQGLKASNLYRIYKGLEG